MSDFDPGYELLSYIVTTLRADSALNALLFSIDAQIKAEDTRVYESEADLAQVGLASVLPRVTVAVALDTFVWEQSGGESGPCTVYVHHFAQRDESVLVQKLAKRTDDILDALAGSTGSLSARIMIAPLTRSGPQIKDRQPAFDEARRITNTYSTRLVGVLV